MSDYEKIEFKAANSYGQDRIHFEFKVTKKKVWSKVEPSHMNFRKKITGKVGEAWVYRDADYDTHSWVAASPWVFVVDRERVDQAKLLVERHRRIDNIEVHKDKFRVALRDGTVISVKHKDADKVLDMFLGGVR